MTQGQFLSGAQLVWIKSFPSPRLIAWLWTPTYGQAKAGRPARTYIQQLCEDTGCSPEDLPEAMNDREKWRERVRDIHANGTTWWWWWWRVKKPSLPDYLFIAGRRIDGLMSFPRALVQSKMQTASSRIWTHFTNSIFNNNNHCTKSASSWHPWVICLVDRLVS